MGQINGKPYFFRKFRQKQSSLFYFSKNLKKKNFINWWDRSLTHNCKNISMSTPHFALSSFIGKSDENLGLQKMIGSTAWDIQFSSFPYFSSLFCNISPLYQPQRTLEHDNTMISVTVSENISINFHLNVKERQRVIFPYIKVNVVIVFWFFLWALLWIVH